MKQTAVEWLIDKILTEVNQYNEEGDVIGIDYWNAFISGTSLLEYVNKAKEMEKKQIERAFMFGQYTVSIENGEQYYNETFKNK